MPTKPDPVETAAAFVAEHHPRAVAAFVGGSVLRGEGTPTSDLDLVIVTTDPAAPYRETFVYRAWTIETFVHSEESLDVWASAEVPVRKPVLAHLAAEGEVVAGQGSATTEAIRVRMQALLDAGPPPLTDEELATARYGITDSLDDLVDSPPGLERMAAVVAVVDGLLRLELDAAGEWSGNGKWIIRRTAATDPELRRRLEAAAATATAGDGDPGPLIELVEARLARYGGRLLDGYRADGGPRFAQLLREATDPAGE